MDIRCTVRPWTSYFQCLGNFSLKVIETRNNGNENMIILWYIQVKGDERLKTKVGRMKLSVQHSRDLLYSHVFVCLFVCFNVRICICIHNFDELDIRIRIYFEN